MNKHFLILSICAIVASCGGGTSAPIPQAVAPTPSPTPNYAPVSVVFIGDSITNHWSDTSALAAGSVNAGVGGERSTDMLKRFDSDVIARNPAVVVILAGTNDIYKDPSPSPAAVFTMTQKAQAARIRVIVGTIPPGGNWSQSAVIHSVADGQAAIRLWNDEIRAGVATYGYTLADYYAAMVLPDGSQNIALFNEDLIHPNNTGNSVMWDVVRPLL